MKVGATLDGRYLVERVLGEGGMGVVFAARDTKSGEAVAIKRLKQPDDDGRRRLLREARAASAVAHPAVVRVIEVLDLDEGPALVLELLQGESLGARLRREGALPPAVVARIVVDVCDALLAAHALGIVHRDLKPDNVFLTTDREHPVKVLDFGIAKLTALDGEVQATAGLSTTTGTLVGTPMYMAPEQVFGERQLDARVDVWAVGLLLFECLTGILPTRADNVGHVLRKILSDTMPRLADVDPDVPADLCAEVDRMLSRERDARPADVDEVRAVLARHAGEDVPPALEHAPTERVDPVRTEIAPDAPAPAPPAPRRSRGWLAGAAALALAAAGLVGATRLRAPREPARPAPTLSAMPVPVAPVRLGMLEAPPPISGNAEALALYRAALGELRDGALFAFHGKLKQALALDPELAAAHLRAAVMSGPDSVEATREHLERARAGRERLPPRDLDLLRLIELDMAGNEPAATLREAGEIVAARPGDAELRWVASALAFDFGAAHEARAHALALLELDRGAAIGQWLLGMAETVLGDEDGARRAIAACTELAPATTACHALGSMVARNTGRCDELDAHARVLIGLEGNPRRFDARLDALLQADPPAQRAVVMELVEQKWAQLGAAVRARIEAQDRARLGLVFGDFAAAGKAAEESLRIVDKSTDLTLHANAARLVFVAAEERGDEREARRVATAFAARRHAWNNQTPRFDVLGAAGDDTLALLAAARRSGALGEGEYAAARGRWVSSIKAAPPQPLVWQIAFALPAASAEQAREALAARPGFAPWPSLYRPARAILAAEGRVHLLAGDARAALPLLRSAAATCLAWSDPVDHVRTSRDLGLALEREGDREGACVAFAHVLRRWGKATPRSLTAEAVRARVEALGCQ
jgi:serine/threonine-protein kinase